MEPVDQEETERLKAFLTFGQHEAESRAGSVAGAAGTEGDELNKHGSTLTNPDQPESSVAAHQ